MAVERNYKCNFCRDAIDRDAYTGFKGIGVYWVGNKLEERPWRDVENHLCLRCLSSIQALPSVCGQGFRDCSGGPKCSSDHK